ncbi:MAG: dTDP-glucose 4,6-dehydratase [Fibrobacterota bacterium]
MKTMLVTGGYGFIGSNFIRYITENSPEWKIVNLDNVTYAGNPANLADLDTEGHLISVRGDITDRSLVKSLFEKYAFDRVVHFAAESHVDRSITGPEIFVLSNVLGTQVLLDMARAHWGGGSEHKRFIHVSTDEVYGALGQEGFFTEDTPLSPNSPYSASKAGSDLLVRSYFKTFNMPVITTRCSNNYGPYQFPEKLIPLMIMNAMEDKPLPVYGDGLYVRDWLYVVDHCSAIHHIAEKGRVGQVYNIGGNNEKKNIDVVKTILSVLKKPETLISYVADRPGHDRRYAISAEKIKNEIGWQPSVNFEEGIARTIQWYIDNRQWWEPLKERAKI